MWMGSPDPVHGVTPPRPQSRRHRPWKDGQWAAVFWTWCFCGFEDTVIKNWHNCTCRFKTGLKYTFGKSRECTFCDLYEASHGPSHYLLVSEGFSSWLLIIQEKTKTPNWLRNSRHGSKVIKKEKWQTMTNVSKIFTIKTANWRTNANVSSVSYHLHGRKSFSIFELLALYWIILTKIHDQLSSDKRGLARHIRHFAGNPLRILISLRMQLVSGCKEVDTVGNIWKGSGLAVGSHQKYLHLPFLQLMLLSNLAIHQTSQIGEGHQRQRKWSLGT